MWDIDIETGIIRWKKKPRQGVSIGNIVGTLHHTGYWQLVLKRKTYFAHRVIWFIAKGYWPDNQIDHIDGNKLNNAISNLREATQQQNLCNQSKPKHNTSGYKGVTWNKQMSKWQAQIKNNKKLVYLGLYHDKWNAAVAYNEAAVKYHGPYAKLNER